MLNRLTQSLRWLTPLSATLPTHGWSSLPLGHPIMRPFAPLLFSPPRKRTLRQTCIALALAVSRFCDAAPPLPEIEMPILRQQIRPGDVVFIGIPIYLFRKVAESTGTWTNHVGVVTQIRPDGEVVIAESTFPFSRETTLTAFVQRSKNQRVAIAHLPFALSAQEQHALQNAVQRRLGTFYDTGFNAQSKRQFCSRFVYEVLAESINLQVGKVETFRTLLNRHPEADLSFWRMWYFGQIPWNRQTITPASLLESKKLKVFFDGRVV